MDVKEEKRKRDRERYARMTDEEKQEKLEKRRQAYQRNKTIREAKTNVQLEPEKRKEEDVATSTSNVRQRKPVTPGERRTLLHRRNEEFSTKQRNTSIINNNDDTEPIKQPHVMITGIRYPLCPINKDADAAQPFSNDSEHGKATDLIISMMKNGDGDIVPLNQPEVMINGNTLNLTAKQKEEINARRRAERNSMTAEKKEEINALRRAERNSLTTEQKEEINACRRAQRNCLTAEQKEEINARRRAEDRAQRNSLTTSTQSKCQEKKAAMLAQRRAKDAARRNTPCKESIAMPCPKAATLTTKKVATSTHRLPAKEGNAPEYTIGTDGDMEAFLSGIMGNDIPDDLMDEKYHMYAREDSEADEMDLDIQTDSTGAEPIDPFDFVYSNLPNRTHILKQVPDCEHCHAKKFERETDGFCCRNGKIKLANQQPEPIPELRRLWSSQDADSRHFRESIRFFTSGQ